MGRQVARRGVRAIRGCMAKGLIFMLAMEVAGSLRVVEGCGQTWNLGVLCCWVALCRGIPMLEVLGEPVIMILTTAYL